MGWEPLPAVMPAVVGYYRRALSAPAVLPVYGLRTVFLPLRNKDFEQMRVVVHGGLAWINWPHDEVESYAQAGVA